ncbi:MAG TPA: SRPBCC family protein [Candidatus Limnocylindrales bacterium]
MPGTTISATIERPIDDVFAVLTDVERTATWFPGDVEEHWTSPPPHGVGSTRHAVVRMYGMRSENNAIVTEFDRPNMAVMRGTSPNAPFVVSLHFSADGHGTQVDVTFELLLRGAARVVGPIFLAWYGRSWKRGLDRLKRLMESGEL